jgi:hypothetical protein
MANSKIYLGNTNIGSLFKGASDISIYLGENKVYPLAEPIFKWKATYSDSHVESAQCGSSSEIVIDEINKTNLVSVELGDCVTSIGWMAFGDCRSLTSVTIPDSVTSIGNQAFLQCTGLTSIVIPNSVTSIGDDAFYECNGLTSITVNAITPPTLINGAFDETNNCPIYVPCESVNAYKSAEEWSNYADRIVCPPFEGKWKATYQDSHVESAQCGSSSEIAYREIEGTGLTSVEIGDCVTSIGSRAFYQYSGLTSVTIPDSVTNIAGDAFKYCSGLTSIDIPSGVTSIGSQAFEGCSGLTSIDIPSGVASIGDRTFYNCNSLTSCTIPNSVVSIGTSAFQNCSGLTSVTIPSGVTFIGNQAFVQCTGLTSITVEATTPPTLDQRAFNTGNSCPIYVPSASVNAYKTATVWSDYASRIQPIS